MALPTITKMQKTAQEMLNKYQQQQAASTTATQSGSTSTPTVSSTPKVTQTQNAQPSVTQPTVTSQTVSTPTQPVDLTKINLFKPQETIKTLQSANLLTQSKKVDSPTITSELAKMYDILPDNMKWPVDDAIENNAKKILYSLWVNMLRSTKAWEAANMFSNKLLVWWARETIDVWQWYINKIYNSWLLPWKRSFMMNMMLPWYWLYRDYLNNKLENTQIWQQTKQVRDTALKTVFDWTERWDQKLANLEWYKYATKKQEEWSDKWKGIRDAIDEWRWDIVATNVWETAWQMLPSLIMAFVTKDPKIAAWWIFATVFWSSYKRSLLEVNNNPEFANLTPDQKDNLATSMAVVEAWIETLWDVVELAPFMKGKSFSIANMFWIKNALLRAVVEWQWASVIEWWEEVLTEILQNAFKRAYGWSDRATAEELWQIFSDTYFIMQFLWLVWWTKWWIETHRRNTAEKLLAHEAEDFDNFEEFLESAHRWWVEDDELIADAWATSKWLTNEERVSIKKDTADIQKQETKARELYEEKQNVESQLRLTPTENETQIKKLETRLQEIDNNINEIDAKINEYMNLYWPQWTVEVVEQQSTPQQQWWENLSKQTMTSIQVNQNEVPTQDRQKMQESFERSVEQMRKENVPYNKTDFATYAYWTSWRTIIWSEQQRWVMVNKVESLLKRIWIKPQYRKLWKWIRWRYDQTINWWKVTYKVNGKEITVYWHEVYHAMMDVIMNWELDDKMMQESLRRDMQEILNEAKEHLWLNDEKYSKGEYRKYADMYAEERLSNAFWEYLANREITWPNMPKTFLEKVVDFFNRVIDFFQSTTNKKTEQELSDAMERVFRTIAEWRVEWWIVKRSPNAQLRQMSAMDESFAETDDELRQTQWEEYDEIVDNTKQEQVRLDDWVNEIADNWQETISEIEDNQLEWEIIDDAMKLEIEWEEEIDASEPLNIAVSKVVNKVEKSVDKLVKDKNKVNAIREVWQGVKDVFTPALSRLYNISPRLAWAVHVYQASVWLKTLWYKRLSQDFVKAMDKLRKKDKKAYKKLSLALFDYWMVDDIDIKQSLKDAGIDEKLFEPVVSILNRIATEYKEAWLDITINDKYFPRKVKDYWLLLDYLSRKSGTNIEWTKQDLLNRIKNINEDPSLSDWEKEVRIHNILINEFTKPSERSNNAKERKLVLSEWLLTEEERKQWYKNDITDFYEDPIVSLSNYIDDMVKKTELKKMLWWLTSDKTAISEEFDDSIAKILLDMEARWELTPEKAEEAKKVIKSIVNARATGKLAQWIKNAVYSMTIANRLSAAQQLEDLSKALLRWPTGFKNIVKSIIGKANIKMDDTWLENAFAQFEWWNITDTLFKLSWFDAVDALWKNSFLNTAYDSCVRQANSDKRSIILKTRLTQMYWEEMWNSIFESYKNNELRDKDWHLKLDVMIDLMYQLGNTQPIYKSAMPTAYLNNPKIRVVYCLWSFTVKQVDWFIQWTKEVYNNQRLLWRSKAVASMAATWRCIWALSVVSIISAMVADLINWAKWDDDELMFKKWREEWFGAFLKQFWINSLSWLLKIFNISKYDQYIFKREWIGWVLMSKITPAPVSIFSDILQVLLGKEELASMWKYIPLFLKPLYYQFKNRDMLPDYKLWWWETEEIWEPTWSRSWSKKTSDRPTTSRSWWTKTTDRPTWSRSWN